MKVIDLSQEENGWTHVKWEIKNVTADMLDWHWSNMDKDFVLWHPEDHEPLEWRIKPTADRFIGAVHYAPQKMGDGEIVKTRLRFYDFDEVHPKSERMKELIDHDHVVIVGRCGIDGVDKEDRTPDRHVMHQWSTTDYGIKGVTSACHPTHDSDINEEKERNMKWAKHCIVEIGNFEKFLPDLYKLWSVVTNPDINIYHSLKVKKVNGHIRYVDI